MIVRWLNLMARVFNELYGTQTNRSYLNILEVIVITKITKNEQRKRKEGNCSIHKGRPTFRCQFAG